MLPSVGGCVTGARNCGRRFRCFLLLLLSPPPPPMALFF
jgi:hypothetical protein